MPLTTNNLTAFVQIEKQWCTCHTLRVSNPHMHRDREMHHENNKCYRRYPYPTLFSKVQRATCVIQRQQVLTLQEAPRKRHTDNITGEKSKKTTSKQEITNNFSRAQIKSKTIYLQSVSCRSAFSFDQSLPCCLFETSAMFTIGDNASIQSKNMRTGSPYVFMSMSIYVRICGWSSSFSNFSEKQIRNCQKLDFLQSYLTDFL